MKNWFKDFGPGVLIAAAFIGPGTVTVCTLAGAQFGFTLLWAMVFSIVATIVLQEMAARLGLISKNGLASSLRKEISNPTVKILVIILVMAAIMVGNAAYEAGNISGGVLGLEAIVEDVTFLIGGKTIKVFSILIGFIAFILLYIGNYKLLEKSLISLVIVMSLSFVITAVLTKPDFYNIVKGLFIPSFPEGSILTIMALIGTTVVPYNLFLHASIVREKWKNKTDLKKVRKDTIVSISLGGVISIAIIICAVAITTTEVTGAEDLAMGLEPLFGIYAKYFLAVGLFAAGITSAITAPLAAAYVAQECFNWEYNLKSRKFRSIWIVILVLGVIFSSTGFKPIEVIKFAQVANGILLPIIAGFLLWVMNRSSVLGKYRNTKFQNILGLIIVIITLVLGIKSIAKVFNLF